MAAVRPWCRRNLARVALRPVLALALALSAGAAPQEDAAALDARVKEVVRALVAKPEEAHKQALLDELEEISARLLEGFASAGEERGRAHLLPLYRVFIERARHDQAAAAEERLRWSEEAEAFAERHGQAESISRARIVRSELYLEFGRVRDGLELSRRTLADFPDSGFAPYVAFAVASSSEKLGEYVAALDVLDRLEEGLPASLPDLGCHLPALRAQVFIGLGVIDRAAAEVRRARACFDQLGRIGPDGTILMTIQELNVALARGRFDLAVARVRAALAEGALYPAGSTWRGVLEGVLGEALLELERRGWPVTEPGPAALTRAGECALFERDRLRVELALAHHALEQGEVPAAAELLERSRARLDRWRATARADGPLPEDLLLAGAEARLALARGDGEAALRACLARLDGELAERVRTWAELSPIRRGGTGFLADPGTRGPLVELARLHLRLAGPARGAEGMFSAWLAVQAQGSIVRARGGGTGSLAEIQAELLEPGRGLLVYLPGPTASMALAIERASALAVELPPEHELERRRGAWLRARESGDGTAARRAAERMRAALLPLELEQAVARWSRGVTFVGLELLGDLPLATLPGPTGELLGTARAIDVLPSLPLGLALARAARATGRPAGDLLLVAAPGVAADVARRFGDLEPLTWAEAPDWPRPPGAGLRLLCAEQATPGRLRAELEAAPVALLQIFAHCVADDTRERPASFVLAGPGEEGLLGCDVIEELPSVPALVLASSCRAALGPRRLGDEGTGHLGGAFLRAGARTVLLSGEDLTVVGARRISQRFWRRLIEAGDTPAEALRSALAAEPLARPEEVPLRGLHLTVLGLGHVPLYPTDRSRPLAEARHEPDGQGDASERRRLIVMLAVLAICLAGLALAERRRAA